MPSYLRVHVEGARQAQAEPDLFVDFLSVSELENLQEYVQAGVARLGIVL